MPEIDGLKILEAIRSHEQFSRIPVLILTGVESSDMKKRALDLGATDFLAKPVGEEDLIPRVRNALMIKSYQDDLERKVRQRTLELEKSRQDIIHCLASAAEYRDNDTGRHVIRVGHYAAVIARELGMEENWCQMLEQAAKLHDVGKIAIPDSILLKPGKLTSEEFSVMQEHTGYGKKICEKLTVDERITLLAHTTVGAAIVEGCNAPLLDMVSTIALTYHERWDGKGYPLGLSGENIPIEGRITSVADVFDALSNKRPYKEAFPLDKCYAILKEGRGTQFEDRIVDAFFAKQDEILAAQIRYADVP